MHAPDHADAELDALMQDKLEAHCRQQLSALVDGALPPDEARFLLRRLQHDGALAGRWERWQAYGDCMRGGVSQLLPADFSQRVCAALQAEDARAVPAAAARGARPAWTRWAGGTALAASVAMAALFVVQREPQGVVDETLQVASSAPAASPAIPVADAGGVPSVPGVPGEAPAPGRGDGAAQSGAAAAGALLLAARERSRSAAARAAPSVRSIASPARPRAVAAPFEAATAQAPMQMVAVAGGSADAAPLAAPDPFGMDRPADARPWPRAVLPGLVQGGFEAGYGITPSDTGVFEYFEPRLPDAGAQVSEPPVPGAGR